jgi:DNA-binding beta-propeller fold protein YncE
MGDDLVTQIAAAPNGAAVYAVHYSNFTCPGCDTRPGIQPAAAPADSVPSGTLTAIDAASMQVGGSLGPGNAQVPAAVAITQNSKYAYVLGTEIAPLNTTVNGITSRPDSRCDDFRCRLRRYVHCRVARRLHGRGGIQLRQRSYAFVSIDAATASVIQTVPNRNGSVISIDSAGNAYVVNGRR